MKKTDWYILVPILLAAVWLAMLPNKRYKYHEISPKELLYKLNLNYKISTDDVARYIIKKDPSVMLIDVRTPEEYAKFTLQGALNIPYDSLLNDKNLALWEQDAYKIILFSNGSTLSAKAKLLLTRMGYDNIYIMDGGLNKWFATIIKPHKPGLKATSADWDLYEFRKGASFYFTGGNISQSSGSAPPPTITVKRKKSGGNIGGCE